MIGYSAPFGCSLGRPTFDMSGSRRQAKLAEGRPLDGGLDTAANNGRMSVHAERIPAKKNLPLQLGANRECHFDRGHVLEIYEADGRFVEVPGGDVLNGLRCLLCVTVSPCLTKESPLDLGLRPVVRIPEAHSTDD